MGAILSRPQSQCINPNGVKAGFLEKYVNMMTADALVPYVMKSSAVMLLNIGYKCKLVLHEEGFILPRCLKMTLNICFHNSSNNSARNGLTSIWSTSTVINKQDPNNYWPTLTTIYHAKSQAMGCAIGVFARAYLWNSGHRSLVQSRLLWFLDISYACAAPTYAPMYTDKQRVLMHRHQGLNVRHGLCHIYMRYLYIYELFIAFVCFVVCSLL